MAQIPESQNKKGDCGICKTVITEVHDNPKTICNKCWKKFAAADAGVIIESKQEYKSSDSSQSMDQFQAAEKGLMAWFLDKSNQFDINATDGNGYSALYIASKHGRYAIVKWLIKSGADKDAITNNKDKSTALHVASYSGHGNIVSFLVLANCKRDIKNASNLTAVDEAKTDEIKKAITQPRRGDTTRFVTDRDNIPTFREETGIENTSKMWSNANKKGYEGDLTCTKVVYCVESAVREDESKSMRSVMDTLKEGMKGCENEKVTGCENQKWCKSVIRAYTMQSSLYRRMNKDLMCDNAISKLDVFAYALRWALLNCDSTNKYKGKAVYRSANLADDQIKCYIAHLKSKTIASKEAMIQWPAFVSTTKNEDVCAAWGGNVTFQITTDPESIRAFDISSASALPFEEEVLIGGMVNNFIIESISLVPTHKKEKQYCIKLKEYNDYSENK